MARAREMLESAEDAETRDYAQAECDELQTKFDVMRTELEDMVTAVRGPTKRVTKFCMACMDGKYPTGDITPEVLRSIECERTKTSRAAEKAEARNGGPG